MDIAAYTNQLHSYSVEKFRSHRIFCDRVLGFQSGQRGVISNGKVSVTVSVYLFTNHIDVIDNNCSKYCNSRSCDTSMRKNEEICKAVPLNL